MTTHLATVSKLIPADAQLSIFPVMHPIRVGLQEVEGVILLPAVVKTTTLTLKNMLLTSGSLRFSAISQPQQLTKDRVGFFIKTQQGVMECWVEPKREKLF